MAVICLVMAPVLPDGACAGGALLGPKTVSRGAAALSRFASPPAAGSPPLGGMEPRPRKATWSWHRRRGGSERVNDGALQGVGHGPGTARLPTKTAQADALPTGTMEDDIVGL